MQRIGIAASKIAQGNLFKYNISVIFIAFLCALLLFFVCGSSIVAALFLVSLIFRHFLPSEFHSAWPAVVRVCLAALGIVIGALYVLAVFKNIKLTRQKL